MDGWMDGYTPLTLVREEGETFKNNKKTRTEYETIQYKKFK